MSGRYAAYPEYKASEVAWLGQMPAHWGLLKTKRIFDRVQRPVRPEDGIVTAFRDGQVTLRSNRRMDGFTNAAKEIGYQGVRKGDLLVHAMDGFAGAIGVSDSDGKCSPVCSVCVPKETASLDVHYYGYLVRQLAVTDFITSLAKGIRERSTEFRFSEFAILPLTVPPLDEQTQIAKFLDYETAKIDALVAKQQQLIALLQEKRQAVISHAVTKGLNPAAPLRDSGVEWLGDVPAHWTVTKVRNRYEVQLGKMLKQSQITGESLNPYLSVFDVQWGQINVSDLSQMDFDIREQEKYRLQPGDLIVNEGGSYVGRSAIWQGELENCFYQKALHRMRPLSKEDTTRFLYYVMMFATKKGVFVAGGNQTTIDHLTASQLNNYKFPFPPIAEQIQIASHLDDINLKFERLISKAEAAVELLQERRTALIAAAVTGKIDVRVWQPPCANAEGATP